MKTLALLKSIAPVLLALGLSTLAPAAQAQAAFPSKPITIVVPFPAGGTTDVVARALQAPLQKILGQTIIIDNKAGASGLIGAKHVQNSAADGYTILLPNNGYLISPLVSKDAGYDALKSFAPIVVLSKQPMILVTHPSVPVNNLKELIAYAKARPKQFEFASSGPLSFTTLSTELFAQRAGIEPLLVAYKGQGPSLQAVLAGEVKALLNVTSPQMNSLIQSGRLRALGVSSPQATPLAAGIPPMSDAVPGFSAELWFALIAPGGTPKDVVNKLNAAVNQALAMPEVREKLLNSGAQALGGSPEQMASMIEAEYASWKDVLQKANIKPQ
ncbi:Bug family tripartite tricarboxylate transporter substrate binding protein [Lacisediminimonas profundi]|uniref:Bug family tripartite tricarboxylate transporter substrate binding protein n=1 Tax=Lacisediminimonas profundi TaxID=2603856 RepID=UPI00124BC2AC|nr:tripartite tricarboxylate transporter substrate binding protein [Lacisediminimonas profundi]